MSDVQFNRIILQRQLETFGVTVSASATFAEARDRIAGASLDLIVADHRPTQFDGAAFVAALRKQGIATSAALVAADSEPVPAAENLHRLNHPVLRSALFRLLEHLSWPDAGLAPENPPSTDAAASSAQPRRMRVLAAEDNRTNQLVLRKMVEDLDIDVVFAPNGHEAVDLWQSFAPDLIFMDISMPGMDGREAAATIRSMERQRDRSSVPIIALTAHAMNEGDGAILTAGIDDWLMQPLKKSEIVDALARFAPGDCLPMQADLLVQTSAIA